MADLVVTAANVKLVSGSVCKDFLAGASITAGQVVYLNGSNQWAAADCSTATKAGSGSRLGIALNNAASGQPLDVQEGGTITPGATLVAGTLYVLSATSDGGNIAPFADLVTGNKINILGIAITTANMDMTYKSAYGSGYSGQASP